VQEPLPDTVPAPEVEPLHLAVVKLRAPQLLSDEILDGVGLTLAQLAKLGLLSTVVVDTDGSAGKNEPASMRKWRDEIAEESLRLMSAIEKHSPAGTRYVDQALGIKPLRSDVPHTIHVRGSVNVRIERLLCAPLKHGTIVIVPPIAFTERSQMRRVSADDVVLALTRQFAGLNLPNNIQADSLSSSMIHSNQGITGVAGNISLDRIIVLDPLGGIPATNPSDNAHTFINLEEEYRTIRSALKEKSQLNSNPQKEQSKTASVLGDSNSLSKFVEDEVTSLPQAAPKSSATIQASQPDEASRIHMQNLEFIHHALKLLPPTSSALLTTPAEAASSAQTTPISQTTGVRTRPKRNPLIHNLLTDKPIISSSLPPERLSPTNSPSPSIPHSTFFKRGMPITIIPNPSIHPWTPPEPGQPTTIHLESDPRIDWPRLQNLIEDSFGRPLDATHYLSRLRGRVAGLIIAGEYEGGAVCTWEEPPMEGGRAVVPYLDKFAVLKRAQGSGGVADIVFNALVRVALPVGVVWRSRADNPVNRWYFERARGSWRVSPSWTMFWTGAGVDFGEGEGTAEKVRRWRDYVSVCRSVEASWADGMIKAPD
jgi:amino-acid N-acetyltransferase